MEEVVLRVEKGVVITIWPEKDWVIVARPLAEPFSMSIESFMRTLEKSIAQKMRKEGK